jgi:hypothetical protein
LARERADVRVGSIASNYIVCDVRSCPNCCRDAAVPRSVEKCHEPTSARRAWKSIKNQLSTGPSTAGPSRWLTGVPLPRAPRRGWESRLADRHVVRPNDDLFAVLPLDRDRFVSGLVSALIDRKIAEERSRLEA